MKRMTLAEAHKAIVTTLRSEIDKPDPNSSIGRNSSYLVASRRLLNALPAPGAESEADALLCMYEVNWGLFEHFCFRTTDSGERLWDIKDAALNAAHQGNRVESKALAITSVYAPLSISGGLRL